VVSDMEDAFGHNMQDNADKVLFYNLLIKTNKELNDYLNIYK
jgi:hypothetical protein